MQNSLLKFRQSFIIFEKYGYLTGKLKILTAPSKYLEGNIFCWNFAHLSYLPVSTKGCWGYFYFV